MSKRLEIARNLLSDKGVIFISIDDNEQAQLKLLCDEVFGETNFIAMYKWNKTATPPSLSQKVRSKYEYILCYEKQRTSIKYNGGLIDGGDAPLLNRGNSRKDILFKKETVSFNFNGRLSAGEYDRVKMLSSKLTTPVVGFCFQIVGSIWLFKKLVSGPPLCNLV